jgi:peptidyl-prolyl cis-trans isomerase A (cyclophilin A)
MRTSFLLQLTLVGLISLITLLPACTSSDPHKPHITIKTSAGDIEVELYPDQAPRTATAFLGYVDSGFYKNGNFYRVLNDDNQPMGVPGSELIQGGIWKTDNKKALSHQGLPHETTRQTHLLHKDGVISLARTTPGTAGTEFFICIGDQPGFEYGGDTNPDGQGYAAFGKVVKGMDIVRAIYARPENDQSFTPPVPIFNITR